MDKRNALINDIVENMLASEELKDNAWDTLALVMKFGNGARGATGYRYNGDKFTAWTPEGFTSIDIMTELLELMAKEEGREWQQALIHVKKADMSFDMQFEYDNPHRWSPTAKSLDMSEYANSLRPAESTGDK